MQIKIIAQKKYLKAKKLFAKIRQPNLLKKGVKIIMKVEVISFTMTKIRI